jgi:hypothetical protein
VFFEVLTQLIQDKLRVDTLSILYPELDNRGKGHYFPNATMQFEPQFPKDRLPMTKLKSTVFLKSV